MEEMHGREDFEWPGTERCVRWQGRHENAASAPGLVGEEKSVGSEYDGRARVQATRREPRSLIATSILLSNEERNCSREKTLARGPHH